MANERKINILEKVDSEALSIILSNVDSFHIGKSFVGGKLIDGDGQITLLQNYYKSLSSDGSTMCPYYQRNKFGRYWSKIPLGIQNMSRVIRHTITRDIYYDLDIKNAHPTFLLYYCTKNNIPSPVLKEFVSDRDRVVSELMEFYETEKDVVKKELLSIMNGAERAYTPSNSPPWIVKFYDEMREILTQVAKLETTLYNLALKNKTNRGETYNIEGTTTNYMMCDLENRALMAMNDAIVEEGYTVGSLVFDGLMVERHPDIDLADLTQRCEQAIFREVGVKVSVVEKAMNEGLDLTGFEQGEIQYLNVYPNIHNLFEDDFISVVKIPPNVRYVRDLDFKNHRVIALSASMGMGKTSSIIRYVDFARPKRILILSPRRTFAKSICNEYNENLNDPFTCYLDVKDKKSLAAVDRLVISMESLHYLNTRIKYDLVIVDECEANLVSHVTVETNGEKLPNNIYVFERLLHDSKRVVLADAFLGKKTLNYMSNMNIPVLTYVYERPMAKRKAVEIIPGTLIKHDKNGREYETTNHDSMLKTLMESLDGGKRSYVFMSSKKRAEEWRKKLKEEYSEKTFLLYTGGKGALENVREEWTKADVVITTATITVGINFDVRNHFHNVFIHASCRSKNLVSDIFQSHYRVRWLIDNTLYYYVSTEGATATMPYKDISQMVDWKESYIMAKNPNFIKAERWTKQLVLDVEYEKNVSGGDLRPLFNVFLDKCNYDRGDVIDLRQVHVDPPEGVRAPNYDEIPLLNEFQMKELIGKKKNGVMLTETEAFAIDKKIFVNVFCRYGSAWLDEEHVSTLWNIWTDFGRSKLSGLALEKNLSLGFYQIEELFERDADKYPYACLQRNKNVKIDWVRKLVAMLGVQHTQQIGSVIPMSVIQEIREKMSQGDQNDLRKCFGLRDQRKNKKAEMTDQNMVDLLNAVLRAHGYTKLKKVGKQKTKMCKGVRETTARDYVLVKNTGTDDLPKIIWDNIRFETEDGSLPPTKRLLPRDPDSKK
jgi:hypothetical protein